MILLFTILCLIIRMFFSKFYPGDQVVIAQWLAWRLATVEIPGSNPGTTENLLISD